MIESNFPSLPTIDQIGAAAASHGTHVTYSTTAPVMDGSATAGTAATVARSDHRHPVDTSRAAASHNHSATNITSGTLAVARGGTGATTLQSFLQTLHPISGVTSYISTFGDGWGNGGYATPQMLRSAMGLGNTLGAMPVANGGTGATTAAAARSALGVAASSHTHAASQITGWPIGYELLLSVPYTTINGAETFTFNLGKNIRDYKFIVIDAYSLKVSGYSISLSFYADSGRSISIFSAQCGDRNNRYGPMSFIFPLPDVFAALSIRRNNDGGTSSLSGKTDAVALGTLLYAAKGETNGYVFDAGTLRFWGAK